MTIIKNILDSCLDKKRVRTDQLAKDLAVLLINSDRETLDRIREMLLKLLAGSMEQQEFLTRLNEIFLKNMTVIKYAQSYTTLGEAIKKTYEKYSILKDIVEVPLLIIGTSIWGLITFILNIYTALGMPAYVVLLLLVIYAINRLGLRLSKAMMWIFATRDVVILMMNCVKYTTVFQELESGILQTT